MLDSINECFDDILEEYRINSYSRENLINKLTNNNISYLITETKLKYLDKLQYLNVVAFVDKENKKKRYRIYKKFLDESRIYDPRDINNIEFDKIDLNVLQTLLDDLADKPIRLGKIQTILDNITYNTFKDFVRYQISGEDWKGFYFLIKCFNLTMTQFNMIRFTDEFPMDKRIKLEALGIWWVRNIIDNNQLLKKHMHDILYELQAKIECNNLKLSGDMLMDLLIRCLHICFEMDEPKHLNKGEKDRDDIKDALLYSNGIYVYRIRFYVIYRYYLSSNKNLNDLYLDSEYLKKTRNEIINILYTSLLSSNKFREDYIKQLFIEILQNRIVEIDSLIEQTEYEEFINHANKNKVEIANIIISFNDSITDGSLSDFEHIFNLKRKSKTSNNPKNITLEESMKVFGLDYTESNITKFREFINKMTFILPNIDDKDILFDWIQIVRLIQKYKLKTELKDQLEVYHSIIEYIYDDLIKKQISFTYDIIEALPNSFALFYGHQYGKFSKANTELKIKLDTDDNVRDKIYLTRINAMLQNQYKRLLGRHLDPENVNQIMNNVIRSFSGNDSIMLDTSTQTELDITELDDLANNMNNVNITIDDNTHIHSDDDSDDSNDDSDDSNSDIEY